jgi:uncharacterized protein
MSTNTVASDRDRLHVLDVLRGIALIGMFFVHFSMFSSGGGSADKIYQSVVELFFEERFWTMFAILFGVGFAIQLRRADARGGRFVANYLRRIGTLAVFGFIAEACFGFNVLLTYAVWGTATARRASLVGEAARDCRGRLRSVVERVRDREGDVPGRDEGRARGQGNSRGHRQEESGALRGVREDEGRHELTGRSSRRESSHMTWFYAQPFSFLPVNSFMLFLLGFIALRLGLFDEPERHRRLIVTLAVAGTGLWAVQAFVFPSLPVHETGPIVRAVALNRLQYGFGLVRDMWLSFLYIGVVLLLVARDRDWLRRLAPFAWTGRMALTNYMIQVALLDLTFSKYGLGLQVTPLVGLTMAVALFAVDAMFSRWWLARFRYGPFEWLWRSATYGSWQSLRVEVADHPTSESLVYGR